MRIPKGASPERPRRRGRFPSGGGGGEGRSAGSSRRRGAGHHRCSPCCEQQPLCGGRSRPSPVPSPVPSSQGGCSPPSSLTTCSPCPAQQWGCTYLGCTRRSLSPSPAHVLPTSGGWQAQGLRPAVVAGGQLPYAVPVDDRRGVRPSPRQPGRLLRFLVGVMWQVVDAYREGGCGG